MTNGEHKEGRVQTAVKPPKPTDAKKPPPVADAAVTKDSEDGAKKIAPAIER